MKALILLIGISGSGKSFYLKNKFLKDFPEFNSLNISDVIVCPDNIRKEFTGDISNHTKELAVWAAVKERLNEKLDKYDLAILDATNLSERGKTTKGLKYDTKIGIVFPAKPDLSKERILNDLNEKVDRSNVPDEAIDKQFLKFKRSIIGNEHWDEIWNEPVRKKIREHLKKEFDKLIVL